MRVVDVELPADSYRILVHPGLLGELGAHARAVSEASRVLLAVDDRIADGHGARARSSLGAAGFELTVYRLRARESRKTLESVRSLYDAMLAARLQRDALVIALGGGIVGDVAGFAAATYYRGVPLVQVPTTLLAMVDAAIGGKTGVNHPLPGANVQGKNLIGSIWQPRAVLADPEVLRTLEPRHLRCGLAECVKHGVIADAALFSFIEGEAARLDSARVADGDLAAVTELVERAARVKVAIVRQDVRELGVRALLNFGHTFAHVIEPLPELHLQHGEAVAIGMRAAARCAERTGHLDQAARGRLERLLARIGLPVRLPRRVAAPRLLAAMMFDKKVMSDRLRLVLPTAIGSAVIADDVSDDVIEQAWIDIGATAT